MQKTKIEVGADLVACIDAHEAARLEVKDGCDNLSDVANKNREAEINFPNVRLVEFGIQTQTSLADIIRKTCCKCVIDDFTEGRHNNLITSLIMIIGAEFFTHIEDSLTICQCQVNEFDCLSINDIDQVSTDIMVLWQEIIRYGGQHIAIDVNMEDSQFESNLSGHHGTATEFLEPLIDEIEMSEELLTKVKYNCLSENIEVIILYDIIQDRFPLHHLQRVVVKKVLNHAILNKGNQCYHRSKQLLLYVRGEGGVRKSRVIKAIHLGFSFLKR